MSNKSTNAAKFSAGAASLVAAEELFLPSVIEVVHHLARMAAEKDYRHFLATGEIPYADPSQEVGDD